MALNIKQKLFVNEYLTNGKNASQAYFSVYKCKLSTARANGHKLLENTDIQALIKAEEERLREKYDLTKEKLLDELFYVIDTSKNEIEGVTDRNAIIKATDLMAKLTGLYAPEKIEVTNKDIQFKFGNEEEDKEDI